MFICGWTDKEGNSLSYEPLGMFTDPKDDNKWSNRPYNKEQKKIWDAQNRFEHILEKVKKHLCRTDRSILEEIELIKTNKSTLPRYCKDWLLNAIK